MSTSEPEEEQKCGSIDHVFIQEDQIDRRRRKDRDYRRTKGCNRGRNPEIRKEMPGTGSADRGTETGMERKTSGSTVARMAAAHDGQLSEKTEVSSGLLWSGW